MLSVTTPSVLAMICLAKVKLLAVLMEVAMVLSDLVAILVHRLTILAIRGLVMVQSVPVLATLTFAPIRGALIPIELTQILAQIGAVIS